MDVNTVGGVEEAGLVSVSGCGEEDAGAVPVGDPGPVDAGLISADVVELFPGDV